MLKRLPYADEPAIPGLILLACLAPLIWAHCLNAVAADVTTTNRWIFVFGMGLALAMLAIGLAGLRFVRTLPEFPQGPARWGANVILGAVMVASSVLVAIGSSFSALSFALALCTIPA